MQQCYNKEKYEEISIYEERERQYHSRLYFPLRAILSILS